MQPLNTEGQGLASFPNRTPYSLFSGSVLGGIGIKFLLNENLTLGIDISANYTFTDYLDDVSTTYADYMLNWPLLMELSPQIFLIK